MIRAVLFDLDGTLVDSAPDLVAALNRVREAEDLPPMPYEQLRNSAALGAAGLVGNGLPPADNQLTEYRKTQLLQYYQEDIYQHSDLFEGVRELIDWLAGMGIPWGVVTNKWERFAIPVMDHAGILASAGCVICGDTIQFVKPHPAPVELACELLGTPVGDSLMVGDDMRDLQAGAAAGCPAVFVNWGYGILADSEAGDWRSFDQVDSLQQWLAGSREPGRVSG
jgi:phosphoglycolate phosphatase